MPRIPRILHQTSSSRELPTEVAENIKNLQSTNAEWKYEFYDDQDILNFIRKNYDARIQKAYDRINPRYGAVRADFFRYLLIYRTGGIYLDIKSGANRKFDDIVAEHVGKLAQDGGGVIAVEVHDIAEMGHAGRRKKARGKGIPFEDTLFRTMLVGFVILVRSGFQASQLGEILLGAIFMLGPGALYCIWAVVLHRAAGRKVDTPGKVFE